MIAKVIRWQNGMVMVFDEAGQQMPDYQGTWEEKREAIERDKPAHVPVGGPHQWPRGGP